MSALDTLSHWRLARDPDGLAWLTFDRAASAVNACRPTPWRNSPWCWTRWTRTRPRAW